MDKKFAYEIPFSDGKEGSYIGDNLSGNTIKFLPYVNCTPVNSIFIGTPGPGRVFYFRKQTDKRGAK